MTAILPSRRWIVRVVTANEVIFAVTADTEVDRRQNAVIVVWRSSCDGDLPPPSFAVFPDGVLSLFSGVVLLAPRWRSWRSIHSDGHSVV